MKVVTESSSKPSSASDFEKSPFADKPKMPKLWMFMVGSFFFVLGAYSYKDKPFDFYLWVFFFLSLSLSPLVIVFIQVASCVVWTKDAYRWGSVLAQLADKDKPGIDVYLFVKEKEGWKILDILRAHSPATLLSYQKWLSERYAETYNVITGEKQEDIISVVEQAKIISALPCFLDFLRQKQEKKWRCGEQDTFLSAVADIED